jgi:hypothetical protein
LAAEVLSLPIFPELSEAQQRQVLHALGVDGAMVLLDSTADHSTADLSTADLKVQAA